MKKETVSSTPHVLGLMAARGNSKGIPRKNLKPLLGRPLLGWTAEALVGAERVDRCICCSDSSEIMAAARTYGLETPWQRPAHLAEDNSLVVNVVLHALDWLESNGEIPFTHVALVQATSPTVLPMDIDTAVKKALDTGADTVISGVEAGQKHPSTMYTESEDGRVEWLQPAQLREARRQDLPIVYMRTGLIYVVSVPSLRSTRSIYGDHIVSTIVPEERALAIDTPFDFKLAELLLKESQDG